MLALRNPNDREPTVSLGVRTTALLSEPAKPAAPAPAPAPKPAARRVVAPPPAAEPPPVPQRTIETIRAAKRTEEVLKGEVIK
jgi:hypothetical protein